MTQYRTYYVYIMASGSRVLYVGVTNDLEQRVQQHKSKLVPSFTSRYNVTRLVWYETTNDIDEAIAFEKKIKLLNRAKKIAMIEAVNPDWSDISQHW